MQFLLLIYENEKRFASGFDPAEMQEYDAFGKQQASAIKGGNALLPTSEAQTVRVRNGKSLTTDGPFAETKELIAGYWIWNVKSVQEAVEWVKRCPSPDNIDDTQEGEIEIRPIFEASDFVSEFAPDIKDQTDRMRDHIEKQKTS